MLVLCKRGKKNKIGAWFCWASVLFLVSSIFYSSFPTSFLSFCLIPFLLLSVLLGFWALRLFLARNPVAQIYRISSPAQMLYIVAGIAKCPRKTHASVGFDRSRSKGFTALDFAKRFSDAKVKGYSLLNVTMFTLFRQILIPTWSLPVSMWRSWPR